MASRALKIDPEKSEQRSVTSEPLNEPVQPAVSDNVDGKEIARLAYQLWQERGCPIGTDQEDWFRAERELAGLKRTGEEGVASQNPAERPMTSTEEADLTKLRFPERSEINSQV
jgi:hypothetical protein